MANRWSLVFLCVILALQCGMMKVKGTPPQCTQVLARDADLLQFALNLHYLEAEFFLQSSIGQGVRDYAPGLIQGPAPVGAMNATLDNVTRIIIKEFGRASIEHMSAILEHKAVHPIQAPLLNLSIAAFNDLMTSVFNAPLSIPYNPYTNTTNFLIVASMIPTLIQQYYVQISSDINDINLRRVASGILGLESAKYGILRTLIIQLGHERVPPYNIRSWIYRITEFVNKVGNCGDKDKELIIPKEVIAGDDNYLTFPRTVKEVLRIAYGTGNETLPGGLFPSGFNGKVANDVMQQC